MPIFRDPFVKLYLYYIYVKLLKARGIERNRWYDVGYFSYGIFQGAIRVLFLVDLNYH